MQTINDGGITTTYGYDAMNRLASATPSTGTATSWLYDFNGNRTKQTFGAAVTNYGYNGADQLCWSGTGTSGTCTPPSGATAYTYDGQGNQTSGGNTYNTFDQLTATTSGGALAHAYAGTTNNQRFTSTGTGFTNNLLNHMSQETTSSATTRYIRDPGGTLIAMQYTTGSTTNSYYYTLDNVSSVIQITDESKAVVAGYTYDAFGNTLTNTGTTAGINNINHYHYATGYNDPTGLTKLGARYYNPTLGRFTQTDPSGPQTNNYLYAGANPTTYNDPSGLAPACTIGTLAGQYCDATEEWDSGYYLDYGQLDIWCGLAGSTLGFAIPYLGYSCAAYTVARQGYTVINNLLE